jgi:hypothetical protein
MEQVTFTRVEANSIRREIHELSKAICKIHFARAALLYKVLFGAVVVGKTEIPLWKLYSHTSFQEFCEREIGLHQTTGISDANMHYVLFEVCKLTSKEHVQELHALGITKCKAIAKVATPGNVFTLLRKAKALSCDEVDELVASMKSGSPMRGRLKIIRLVIRRGSSKQFKRDVRVLCAAYGTDNAGDAVLKGIHILAGAVADKARPVQVTTRKQQPQPHLDA